LRSGHFVITCAVAPVTACSIRSRRSAMSAISGGRVPLAARSSMERT
jgi:hypothetical protein